MILFRKVALWSLVLLMLFSGVASAASKTISDANGKLIMEATNEGNQVKLSFSYQDLAEDFTGFNLEIRVPDELDEFSGKFNSDNFAIKFSAADNFDTTVDLYKLVILSPALTSSPQGKNGKIGNITFNYKPGRGLADLAFLFPVVRVYGGGEQIILRKNEPFLVAGPDTTKPVVAVQPAGGTYNAPQTVTLTITDNDASAKIHYTLDGSEPKSASPVYTAPLTITGSTVLKFIGIDSTGNQSDVVTERYTIDTTRPEVSGVEIKDDQTLTVAFSKPVADHTADLSRNYFTVAKQSNTQAVVQIASIALNAEKTAAELKLASALEKNVDYSLTVKGVMDAIGNEMTVPYQTSLKIEDKEPPAPVTGLTAAGVTTNTITISWEANKESDLDGYGIYLNGVFQTKVNATSYTAFALAPDTSYELGVEAVDVYGNKASVVTVTGKTERADMTGPEVTAVKVKDDQTLTVSFNEAVADETANLSGNHFSILKQGNSQAVVQVSAVTLNADKTAAEIRLAAPLEKDVDYTLTIKGVKDRFGNAMAAPYTSSIKIIGTLPAGEAVLSTNLTGRFLEVGDEVKVTISASGAENLYAAKLLLTYDAAKFEYVSSTLNSQFGKEGDTAFLFLKEDEGKLSMALTAFGDSQGRSGNVALADITFKVKANGSATLIKGSEFSNVNGQEVELNEEKTVSVTLSNSDVNGDGRISVADIGLVVQAFGKTTFDPRLDFNHDGKIDIEDIAYVARKLLES